MSDVTHPGATRIFTMGAGRRALVAVIASVIIVAIAWAIDGTPLVATPPTALAIAPAAIESEPPATITLTASVDIQSWCVRYDGVDVPSTVITPRTWQATLTPSHATQLYIEAIPTELSGECSAALRIYCAASTPTEQTVWSPGVLSTTVSIAAQP